VGEKCESASNSMLKSFKVKYLFNALYQVLEFE